MEPHVSIQPAYLSELSIPLPAALQHIDDIVQSAENKRVVIFLDYDGTLTPIVARPEDAHLPDTMRDVLAALARTYTVAIVSGRDLADVRQRVHLETLYYAGSHGFEIAGPGDVHALYGPAHAFLTDLDRAESALRERFDGLPGAQVERKHFTIAVHFRRVHEEDLDKVMAMVHTIPKPYPTLRQTSGKKVIELRPDLDWNKGTALFWLLEIMGLDRDQVWPVYIGDDLTDEDAFLALQNAGVGIIVTDGGCRSTAARYALSNIEEVRTFLMTLTSISPRSGTA
jgi:trehalose 6-phosphate phosphatase